MSYTSYRDLEVWQKAMDLVILCYQITEKFPKNECFGITSQLKRAIVSVPANIAEGRERQYGKEFNRYLSIAYGSLAEVETYLFIAQRLDYINSNDIQELLEKTSEVGRMINGLYKAIRSKFTGNS